MIVFDPVEHTYTLDGERLPNVTGVLDILGGYEGIPSGIMTAARDRGDYVHKACEMMLWGTLDEDSILEEYRPYIDAFRAFLEQSGAEIHGAEERVWHKTLKYAGTADIIAMVPKRQKPRKALIDIKTTAKMMPTVGPQLAAYQDAYNSQRPKAEHVVDRYGLKLNKDGTYKLDPYTSPNDSAVFRACLTIHRYLKEQSK